MKLCPYCNKKISWFFGIDHTRCNTDAEKHKSYIRTYIKKEALSGRFNRIAPEAFFSAQKYLPIDDMEAEMAAGYDDAVEEMCGRSGAR